MKVIYFTLAFIIVLGNLSQAQITPQENFKFGMFKLEDRDYQASINYLNEAIKQDTVYINAYLLRAKAKFELKQYFGAISDINKAVSLERNKNEALSQYVLIKAKAYQYMGEKEEALGAYEQAATYGPKNPKIYYERALFLYQQENFESALDDINTAIKLSSNNAEYHIQRAEIKDKFYKPEFGDEIYTNIVNDYTQAINIEPSNYRYYMLRSKYYQRMGDEVKALNDYNTMVAMSPYRNEAYAERGVISMHNYEYQKALVDFSKSIEINPNDERSYRYRGVCYHNLNNYYAAYEDFSKSIALLTEDENSSYMSDKELKNTVAELHIMRGHSLTIVGQKNQACYDFLKAVELGVRKGLNYYRRYCGY